MRKAEGRKGPTKQRTFYNPKAQLNNSTSEMVYRPKNWDGTTTQSPVKPPSVVRPSGPRPRPKRK